MPYTCDFEQLSSGESVDVTVSDERVAAASARVSEASWFYIEWETELETTRELPSARTVTYVRRGWRLR